MSYVKQYCTFWLQDLFLGIEVSRVQEVLRNDRIADVPLSDSVVAGLINLRGQIVTALDLRLRFGLPPKPAPEPSEDVEPPMNVVVRDGEDVVSFLVDEIGDVLEVDERSFESPPATLVGVAKELIQGIHKLEGQLMLVLDVERALDFGAVTTPATVA